MLLTSCQNQVHQHFLVWISQAWILFSARLLTGVPLVQLTGSRGGQALLRNLIITDYKLTTNNKEYPLPGTILILCTVGLRLFAPRCYRDWIPGFAYLDYPVESFGGF